MTLSDQLSSPTSKIVDRYSSLFTLPSKRTVFACLTVLCLLGGYAAAVPRVFSLYNFALGTFLGVSFFVATLLAESINSKGLMSKDPVFSNLRRCLFLSIPSCLFLFVFLVPANLLLASSGDIEVWAKIVSAGFFVALTLRLLVFATVSSVSFGKALFSALFQPLLLLVVLLVQQVVGVGFQPFYLFPFLVSMFLASLGVYFSISWVDDAGKKTLGFGSLSIFKAFLANWTENLNEPLEGFFERLGEETDVKISLLAFRTGDKFKAAIIVPVIHHGPFKNVGSSRLPHMIQSLLEAKLGCVISVPHGISGHDLDLASQLQNEKLLNTIAQNAEFKVFSSHASPFVRSEINGAKASCQIFGECALFTLTLAPETMEDLPRKLEYEITSEVKKRKLASALVIDAHNSFRGSFNIETVLEPLKKSALDALEKALHCERYLLEVGAAKVSPREFSVKDGMGPGGITAVVFNVGAQKAAYVTIDGNNMVSGLRETILSRLKRLGLTEGEILTTDTHMMTGIVKNELGYHPIGEATDQEKLIDYIETAVSEALKNLSPAKLSWREETIPNIKVIGEKQLQNLSLLTERTAKKAKKMVSVLFPALAVAFAIILVFL